MPARMRLSSVYSALPPAERKVADFIMNDPDRAARMVINDIAREAEVSVPSVTRLAKKLGYSGFMEFRVALASDASVVDFDTRQPISETDGDEILLKKMLAGHMLAIESSLKVLSSDRLSELASKVSDFRRVLWFAVGSVSNLAKNISDSFCRMGIDSFVIDDRGIMNTYAERTDENDLVICLTRSGKTKQTLDCLRTARQQGAVTVLLTNMFNSDGEKVADYYICTSHHDDLYRIFGYESGTAMCALLESFMILVGKHKMAGISFGKDDNMYLYLK